MGVNSLPKTVTQQHRGCDLNPGPSVPEFSMLIAKFHYTDTDPNGPARTQRSFAAKKCVSGPCRARVRVRVEAIGLTTRLPSHLNVMHTLMTDLCQTRLEKSCYTSRRRCELDSRRLETVADEKF